jgi:hypothetical protein
MNWVLRELQKSAEDTQAGSAESASDRDIDSPLEERAAQCWRGLAQGFAADVDEFRKSNGIATFDQSAEFECRISNPAAAIATAISADIPELMIHYDYQSEGRNAGVPEGGVLTIRDAGHAVELYSADQRLSREQARKLILEPVLFPSKSDALEQTGT